LPSSLVSGGGIESRSILPFDGFLIAPAQSGKAAEARAVREGAAAVPATTAVPGACPEQEGCPARVAGS